MAFDGNNVHILGLSPKEQFLLRLVLTNLVAGYIDKSVVESAGGIQDLTDRKASQAVNFFIRYCDFVDMLCPESMLGKISKGKVLMIKPQMMKYIVMAFNGYDPYNNYLSPDQRHILSSGFDSLQKKVAESFIYTYNRYEIERAKT